MKVTIIFYVALYISITYVLAIISDSVNSFRQKEPIPASLRISNQIILLIAIFLWSWLFHLKNQ